MSQKLHGLGLLILARYAVGRGELVVAADGLVLLEDLCGVVGSLLRVVQDEVGDFDVVLGRLDVKDSVPGRELDRHGEVGAVHGCSGANESRNSRCDGCLSHDGDR